MLNRYFWNKKGLSLVEVLIAATLLLLVFTGFINMLYYSVNLKVNSRSRLQAILAAQSCIEEIRSARGEDNSEWSDISELETWLADDKGYSKSSSGVYVKDNIVITLVNLDQIIYLLLSVGDRKNNLL